MTHYGFDETKVKITKEDYKFGFNLPRETINPSADWREFIPLFEPQASIYETYGCTVWGGLNQIETYIKKVFGTDENYSDRYNYILAKIKPPGASPTDAYETFRKQGVIEQELLPYSNTYEEFLTPDPMDMQYINKGKKWLETYDYKHEWMRSNDMHAIIKHGLRYSPIAISVSAWFEKNGVYVDYGTPNNHWCLCVAFDGDSPIVFDSYDHSIKKLSPDHTIKYAKRILITKKKALVRVKPRVRWSSWFNLFRIYKFGNKHHANCTISG